METRNVHDDIFGAKIPRQPAPAVHVEPDAVALGFVACRRRRKRRLESFILRVSWQQAAERRSQIVRRDNVAKERVLLGCIEVVVDHPPVDPPWPAYMAEREVSG